MDKPLRGVRILDLTRLLPGAVCSLHLADLGADVIKIEEQDNLERSLGARAGETSVLFKITQRNKRSAVLDLKTVAGKKVFLKLAQHADVLIESFRPGIVDKLGIGYTEIKPLNPKLIYCSITGYGQSGPYRDRAGHDINYLAYAGVLEQSGTNKGPPTLTNVQIADLIGGAWFAAMGILAALYDAQRNGQGRYLDVAMTDGVLAHNLLALHALQTEGATPQRGRGLLTGGVPCYQIYTTQDGRYLAVGALEEKFWSRLCDALQRPDLKAQQFATDQQGEKVQAELRALFASQPLDYWIMCFQGIDCCVAPVLTLAEALQNEHLQTRQMWLRDSDNILHYSCPLKMSGFTFTVDRPAPALGEHTAAVLDAAGWPDQP